MCDGNSDNYWSENYMKINNNECLSKYQKYWQKDTNVDLYKHWNKKTTKTINLTNCDSPACADLEGGVLKIQTVKIHIVKLWKIRSVRLDFICKTNIRRMHRLTFGNRLVASFDRKVRWRTPILIAGLKRPVWNLPFFQVWRKLLIRWCTEIKKNVDIC